MKQRGFDYQEAMRRLRPELAAKLESPAPLRTGQTVCKHCRDPFLPTRKDARFCSNRCRQAAYRLRVTASTAAEARCCIGAQPTPTHPESNGAFERGSTAAKAVTATREGAQEVR